MKVVQLVKTLATGGAELHLLTLCRELVKRGVDVVVASMMEDLAWGTRHLDADFRATGSRVTQLASGYVPGVGAVGALRRLLEQERPNLLHTHLPRADLVGAWADEGSSRVPLVSSVHDIYSKSQWRGRWALPMVRRSWRRCDAVIAISGAVKEWLTRDMGMPDGKVKVIHYGIDVERFRDARDGGIESAAHGTHVVGTIGRLEPRKGHDCLIRALPAIRHRVGPVELRIAGNDPWGYGRTLRELAQTLGVGAAVKFVGFEADIAKFLHSVDVFAFASRSEGFGQVIVEAMASGVPIVASRIAPITEIVADGDSAILASPDEPDEFAAAISKVLQSRSEMSRMRQQALTRVREHFSAARMAGETLGLYQSLVRAG